MRRALMKSIQQTREAQARAPRKGVPKRASTLAVWLAGSAAALAPISSFAEVVAAEDARRKHHTLASRQGETQKHAAPLSEVKVHGAADADGTVGLVARRSRTGTKTDTALNEIPQTINVITAEQIEETGATSVNEALRYIPGFSSYGSELRSDFYSVIRGFTPTVFADGLQVPNTLNLASWRVDPFMIASLTILRGPSSVLYGQGDPGATIDIQSKLANGQRIREMETQLGNYARKQVAFDIGDKLDKDGKWSYRFQAVGRDGNALTGPNNDQRVALSPSFRWQPNDGTALTVSANYLQDWGDASNNFLPAKGTIKPNLNGVISPNLYTGDPSFSHYRKKQWSLGYHFEHTLNPTWTFRQNARLMHLSLNQGQVYGGGLDESDPSQRTMNRYVGLYHLNYSRFDLDNQVQAKFATGGLTHTALVGLEYNRQNTTDSEWWAQGPGLDMYKPVYTPITRSIFEQASDDPRTDARTQMDMVGVYLQDQIKWRRWVLTLGARHDWSDTTKTDVRSGSRMTQKDQAFSWRTGLVFLGDYGLSPYIGYSTSFNPLIGLKLQDGSMAKPTRGEQMEIGLRWEPPGKNLALNAALYQIKQTNVATPDPIDPSNRASVQTGEVRSRGVELSVVGKLTPELSIIAGYVYQDVKNTKANDKSLNKWPVDIPRPRQIASLWADYTWRSGPLADVGIGAGVRYQSGSAGRFDNTLWVPGYTIYDAALHYDIKRWRLAVKASNLFNRRHVSGCQSEAACFYGNQRTVMFTGKYDW